MGFIIHHDPEPPKLVRMGHAAEVIAEPKAMAAAMPIPDTDVMPPPVVDQDKKRGRPKKMADKKLSDETGVKKISQDDAGTQGAIGSGGVNAPAQEKVPEKSPQQSEQGKEE